LKVALQSQSENRPNMKFTFTKSEIKIFLTNFVVVFLLSDVAAATSDSTIIKCKASNDKILRIWKYTEAKSVIKFWTFHEDKFYPFCTQGLSMEFPSGFLCAFNKTRQAGTIATYIDIQKAEITDILIREDTILEDPSTWVQKTKTSCELIRQ
jgi:hypothetical protein